MAVVCRCVGTRGWDCAIAAASCGRPRPPAIARAFRPGLRWTTRRPRVRKERSCGLCRCARDEDPPRWARGREVLIPEEFRSVFARLAIQFRHRQFRLQVDVRVVGDGNDGCGRVAPDQHVAGVPIYEAPHRDRLAMAAQIVVIEFQREKAIGGIKRLPPHAHLARVPVNPHDAARPRARPRLTIRRL